ncbi:hypothetical protein MAPG_08686, partial [Magnaporthiopsis poae ATCC 64411]
MKFSSAISLGFAAQVLAKAAHNVYPVKPRQVQVRRDGMKAAMEAGMEMKKGAMKPAMDAKPATEMIPMAEVPNGAAELLKLGMAGAGLTQGVTKADVVIIWVNGGGGAATTKINEQSTVTVTTTVTGGAAGATPPAGGAAPPAQKP